MAEDNAALIGVPQGQYRCVANLLTKAGKVRPRSRLQPIGASDLLTYGGAV